MYAWPVRVAKCEICQRTVLPGMYVFDLELRSGRRGVAHSLCEAELKKTEEGVESENHEGRVRKV